MAQVATIWWFCLNCGCRFRSPTYEPLCCECCGYQGRGERWTLFEKLFAAAIMVGLALVMVWLR